MTLHEYAGQQEGWNGTDFSSCDEILSANPGMTFDVFAAALTAHSAAYDALQRGGFKPEGYEFYLDMSDEAQTLFSRDLALLREELDLGIITNEDTRVFADVSGTLHTVTVLQYRQILAQYGGNLRQLWAQSRQ